MSTTLPTVPQVIARAMRDAIQTLLANCTEAQVAGLHRIHDKAPWKGLANCPENKLSETYELVRRTVLQNGPDVLERNPQAPSPTRDAALLDAIDALTAAQSNIGPGRPSGSADPADAGYDHDAFAWDRFQRAIDGCRSALGQQVEQPRVTGAQGQGASAAAKRAEFEEALQAYWDAAYVEGQEGRDHDTEDGRAQKALQRLMALFSANVPPAALERKTMTTNTANQNQNRFTGFSHGTAKCVCTQCNYLFRGAAKSILCLPCATKNAFVQESVQRHRATA